MLTVRHNPATLKFDCYKGQSIIPTLTCGTRFNLCDDEDIFVAGRIEYHNVNGYYFICGEGFVTYFIYWNERHSIIRLSFCVDNC